MRTTTWPPRRRASSQQYRAVRAPPMCRKPVGLGAKRVRTVIRISMGSTRGIVDFNGYGRVLRSQLAIIAALCPATPRGSVIYEQGLPTWTLNHDDGVRSSQYTTDSLLRIGLGANLELQLGS